MTTNVESVSDALAERGIGAVFGLIGDGNLDLISDLVGRKGMHYLGLRHENAVVAAGDGFSRAGAGIGIATITHGPGFTNALTALVTAQRAHSRLLVISGSAMGYTHPSTQKLDHAAVARVLDVPVIAPRPDDDWGEATARALALAESGTVLLDLPTEAVRLPATRGTGVVETAPPVRSRPSVEAIVQAASLLAAAERPVILAGRGAWRAGVRAQLLELAHAHGAHLGTSLAAKGLFRGEPGDIGVVGGLATPLAVAACQQCDLVLVAGAGLNGFTTLGGTLFGTAKVVRLDKSAQAPSTIPVHLELVGDISATLAALKGEPGERSRWSIEISPANAPARDWPAPVLERLDRSLPGERTVVFDHGSQSIAAIPSFGATDPTQSICMPDFGSLGLSVAAAIGATTARPDRRTIVVAGDGGLMMSLSELDTLKRSGLPITVVVLNDGVYGAEYPHLVALGAPLWPATFDTASIAGIAKAIGLWSCRIPIDGDLDVLGQALSVDGPALVEVMCAPPGGAV